jgi:DNA-binding transcriptional MocR family regulator
MNVPRLHLAPTAPALAGRISARRLLALLGRWHTAGARRTSQELAGAIRKLILDGSLTAGTQLPPERQLSEVLGVSRTLVTSTLDRLRADGVVASKRGAGSWVTLPGAKHPAEGPHRPELIDLARAAPEAIPKLVDAIDAARLSLPNHLHTNGYHTLGLPGLRAAIADKYTARGLDTDPDQILITNGAHHAFTLVLAALCNPGERCLVEHPAYANALDAISAARLLAVGVPMIESGWDIENIGYVLRRAAPRLCYFIADFQNPTGHRMNTEDRQALGRLLRRTRTTAVVDETLVEMDFTGDPRDGPAPAAAFAPEQVITVGSVSKSHWGGLRIGWLRANRELVDRLSVVRNNFELGTPVFEQLILTEMFAMDSDVLRERRARLAARRDALADGLRTHCPQWTFEVPDGGLSLWCDLGAPVSTRLSVAAQRFGLRLAPGGRFSAHGGLESRIRVPFGLPPEQLLDCARRLGRAFAELESVPVSPRDAGPVPVA